MQTILHIKQIKMVKDYKGKTQKTKWGLRIFIVIK